MSGGKEYQPRPGDCVRLKSGGPKMTIVKVIGFLGVVECRWFKSDDSFEHKKFDLVTLEILEGAGALAS